MAQSDARPKVAILDSSRVGRRDPAEANQVLATFPAIEPVNSPDLTSSESINVWPDEAAEAAFLSETREVSVPPAPKPEPADEAETAMPLPKLDELVNRIPAEARGLLDELFRAKFTAVRRVKASDLKN